MLAVYYVLQFAFVCCLMGNSRGSATVHGPLNCIQRCQKLPISLCIIFGQYILFHQAELYGLVVWIQISSEHHLNVMHIIIAYGCYVIMSIICVHCVFMCVSM